MNGFFDLLSWMFAWRSVPSSAPPPVGPFSVAAAQVHVTGATAGQTAL